MSEGRICLYFASDGYPIHFRRWDAEGKPRGIVLPVHGIQSHSGWYTWSCSLLARNGFHVLAADRRGSGLNGRRRGHAAHGEQLIHDLRALRRRALREYGRDLPVILQGVSWGGKLAAATAIMFPAEFQRLVLLYPGLKTHLHPNWLQQKLLTLARQLGKVREHIPIPLQDSALFTADASWRQFIEDDPLSLHTVTSEFLNATRDLDELISQGGAAILCPVLMMLAEHDRIVNNPLSETLVRQIALRLSVAHWPNAQHTLEFESEREPIFARLVDWLLTANGDEA